MTQDYYQRRESRIERLNDLAQKNTIKAEQLHDQAHKMAEVIPFGQPILIGHHSEKSDRSYRNKIHNKFEKAFETAEKADYYKQRALSAAGNDAISSDAPDAIELLKEKLQNLKDSHAVMISANKILKSKKLTNDQKIQEMQKLGISESEARGHFVPDFAGRIGYPNYAITNSGANIRNVEKRIEALEQAKNDKTTEIEIGDVSIVNSVEDNRIMVFFPGVPNESIRARLKSDGFRWSPSSGAWQAYRSAAWKIPEIIKFLSVMPAYVNPSVFQDVPA